MKLLKERWQTGVSILLAVAIFTTAMYFAPINVQAAEKVYISEMFLSVADTEEDAKAYLTDFGYTIIDNNLCAGMDWGDGLYSAYVAYLGYRTTTDPLDAITDMAVMDMNGKYDPADYAEALEAQEAEVTQTVQQLRTAIDEFRSNYNAGLENAVAAYDMLNMYYEDDTRQLLGDFILNEATTDEQMVTLFMQGSSYALPTIYQYIMAGCGDGQALIDKLAALDMDTLWSYVDDPGWAAATENIIDDATSLITEFNEFKQRCNTYELDEFSTEEDINAALADYMSEEEILKFKTTWLKYYTLQAIPYGDDGTTWLDIFQQDTTKLDKGLFYPIVAIMSEGQRVMAAYVTLDNILFGTSLTEEVAEEAEEMVDQLFEGYENNEETMENLDEETQEGIEDRVVSIYAGVDRSLFEATGVALTDEANTQWGASGDSSWIFHVSTAQEISLVVGLGIAAATMIGSYVYRRFALKWVHIAENNLPEGYLNSLEAGRVMQLDDTQSAAVAKWQNANSHLTRATSILGIALGVAVLISALYTGVEIYNYFHPEYKEIPRGMVNTGLDNEGKKIYLRYTAVGQVMSEKGADITNQYGYYADLNGWSGKQWNALYTTKDQLAGKPILAEGIRVQYNDNSYGRGEGAVHFFNRTDGYDINTHAYSVEKSTQCAYIIYSVDTSFDPYDTASVFASTDVILFSALSAVVGLIIGGGCVFIYRRRKRKQATA